ENRGNGQETTSLEVQALLSQVSPKIMDALFGGKEELAKRGFNMDVATNGTIASAYSQYANGKKLRLPNSIARVEPGFLINENGDSVLNKEGIPDIILAAQVLKKLGVKYLLKIENTKSENIRCAVLVVPLLKKVIIASNREGMVFVINHYDGFDDWKNFAYRSKNDLKILQQSANQSHQIVDTVRALYPVDRKTEMCEHLQKDNPEVGESIDEIIARHGKEAAPEGYHTKEEIDHIIGARHEKVTRTLKQIAKKRGLESANLLRHFYLNSQNEIMPYYPPDVLDELRELIPEREWPEMGPEWISVYNITTELRDEGMIIYEASVGRAVKRHTEAILEELGEAEEPWVQQVPGRNPTFNPTYCKREFADLLKARIRAERSKDKEARKNEYTTVDISNELDKMGINCHKGTVQKMAQEIVAEFSDDPDYYIEERIKGKSPRALPYCSQKVRDEIIRRKREEFSQYEKLPPSGWIDHVQLIELFLSKGVLNKDDEDFDFKKQKVSNTAGEMLRQGKVKLVNKFYPDGKLKRFVSPAGVQIIREKII
ncbi:MAG: hypothetical protein ABID45_03120, partial [Patescibacteria group bacterium]